MARGEAELARGLLLEGRGGEGRRGVAALSLALHALDDEAPAFQRCLEPHGGGFIGDIEFLELLAVDCREAGEEGFVLQGGKLGCERPIFLGLEGLDFGFAVADEPQRHGLHAAG